MAGTRKVYGAKEIGLRGTLLKAGPDGGIDIPHADVAEVVKAFGLSLEPPKQTAPRKVDPARKARVDALVARAKALGESVPEPVEMEALYLDTPDKALDAIDASLSEKEKAKADAAAEHARIAAATSPAAPAKKGGK